MATDVAQTHGEARQPLGELLVGRGLITLEQLEQALAIQCECKRPLGEIVIRLGFASAPTIAQALASQQGSVFKSEYGFATGFDTAIDGPELGLPPVTVMPPVTVRDGDKVVLVPAPASAELEVDAPSARADQPAPLSADVELRAQLAAAETRLDQFADQLASAAVRLVDAETARDAALTVASEHAAANTTLEQATTKLAARIETLESELMQARTAAEAATNANRQRETALRQRVIHLEGELRRARSERDAASAQLHATSEAHMALERTLEAQRQEQVVLERAVASMTQQIEQLRRAEAEIEAFRVQFAAAHAERDEALVEAARLQRLLDAAAQQPSPVIARHADEERHLVFFHVADRGYLLLEHPGPTPPIGAVIDLSRHGGSATASVIKIAHPPLAGSPLRCAYLL